MRFLRALIKNQRPRHLEPRRKFLEVSERSSASTESVGRTSRVHHGLAGR
jgi:hypothetical protein